MRNFNSPISASFEDICIETPRLVLRPVTSKFREDIFREFTPEITRYMAPLSPKDISETDSFIRYARGEIEAGTGLLVAILSKGQEEFLGIAGLEDVDSSIPELGLWIKKAAHGNHFGYEAIQALFQWAKENLEFSAIRYPVSKENYPSRKIPEKLGGLIVAEQTCIRADGVELDEIVYHLK